WSLNLVLYCFISCGTENAARRRTLFGHILGPSHDKMRKRRKARGEEFRFWSYMPPFFFDFFFFAFVGLFTRFSTHNGVCLRILLFSRRHDISWRKDRKSTRLNSS